MSDLPAPKLYRICTEGTALETYMIRADSEEEARQKFLDGKETEPVLSEVVGSEITSCEFISESAEY